MSLSTPPPNFLLYNNQLSKNLNIVVDIAGLPYFSSASIYRYLQYGDLYDYGDAINYGGSTLVPIGSATTDRGQKNYLILDGGALTISQRLEPEQGRGSISTMSLSFIDKDGYMTKALSPGVVIPEILGQQVKIWIGYGPTSFPDDYFIVWRGRVGQVSSTVGKVTMQFVDPNVVRRQQVFYPGQTTLVGNLYITNLTLSGASYSSGTWTYNGHGMAINDVVTLSESGGALPTGYLANTPYFVVSPTTNTFVLSITPYPSYITVATSDNGSGTLTVLRDCTIVIVNSSGAFFQKIKGPFGTYDEIEVDGANISGCLCFLKIDDEFIEYQQFGSENTGFGATQYSFVTPSANATAGAVYTDSSGNSYTVIQTISGLNELNALSIGSPPTSGTLTKSSGSGDSTITYYSATPLMGSFVGTSRSAADFFQGNYAIVPTATPTGPNTYIETHTGQASDGSIGTTVDAYFMMAGHPMDIALKIMMSGWNGPYVTGQAIQSIVATNDAILPSLANGITLPMGIDAIRDLGITTGDLITISGDGQAGNNNSFTVTGFNDLSGETNRTIQVNTNLTLSNPSTGVIAIRSQYDVYPTVCGSALPGWEVDVTGFQYYKNTFIVNSANFYRFLLNGDETAKTFIESEILLPVGMYSLTRQGKISCGLTKPPIADQRTQVLTISNVIDPQNIQVSRGVNNRKFFNEIDWSYDCDDSNSPRSQRDAIDANSLNLIGISSVLPIASRGARSYGNENNGSFLDVVVNRETWIFNRYRYGSTLLDLKTFLGIGNQIEAGDVLVVNDSGQLQIPNFATGLRNLGIQYFEVINRDLDLKSGVTTLQLEGGIGSSTTDRYATIAPSSILGSGCTASLLKITDSYGSVFGPGNEFKKWTAYAGLGVRVHSADYSTTGTTTFTGFDSTNTIMQLSTALGFAPSAGYIVELEQYPTSVNPTNDALAKFIHAFMSASVAITGGSSNTVFTVGAGDIGKFAAGQIIRVRNPYATGLAFQMSPDVIITNIATDTITVSASLGFTPTNTSFVEGIGFADGGQFYRFV